MLQNCQQKQEILGRISYQSLRKNQPLICIYKQQTHSIPHFLHKTTIIIIKESQIPINHSITLHLFITFLLEAQFSPLPQTLITHYLVPSLEGQLSAHHSESLTLSMSFSQLGNYQKLIPQQVDFLKRAEKFLKVSMKSVIVFISRGKGGNTQMLKNSKKALIILVILAFSSEVLVSASVIVPDTINFDDDKISVSSNSTHTTIALYCKARIGECSFRYNFIPSGWVSDNNKLIFSNQERKKIRSYVAQVSISEIMGDWIFKSLIFDNEFGKFTLRSQTISSSLSNKSSSTSSSSSSQTYTSTTSSSYTTQPQTDDRYSFLKKDDLPSTAPLSRAIRNQQSSTLTMQVQKIISYTMSLPSFSHPCPSDFYNLLKTDVLPIMKQYTSSYEQENSMQRTKKAMLQSDISRLEGQKKEMLKTDLESLKKQINDLSEQYGIEESEKNRAFNTYYSSNIIADRYKEKIDQMMPMITNESKLELQQIKESISRDEIRLKEIDQLMRELQVQRGMIKKRVDFDKKKVETMEKYQNQVIDENRLKSLENSYRYYRDQAAANKKIYEQTQIKLKSIKNSIQKLKTQVTNYEATKSKVQQEIAEKKKTLEEVKASEKELSAFRQNLAINQNKIENELMQCQALRSDMPQVPAAQTPTTPPKTTQSTTSQTTASQPSSGITQNIIINNPTTVNFNANTNTNSAPDYLTQMKRQYSSYPPQDVNIYSSAWIYAYGVPKPGLFICSNQTPLNSRSYTYGVSYSIPNPIINGYGRILAITNTGFRILLSSGNTAILLFSLCTQMSIMSPYQIPRPGDIIEWNGVASELGEYRLSSAVIYPTS